MLNKKNKPAIPQPGENVWPFKLGDEVKDKINGITGVLIERFFHRTGCDRFQLELSPKDGAVPEVYFTDAGRLELVKAHPERHIDEVPDMHFKLGDKARDHMIGLTGTIGIISVPLFGAVRASIDPAWDEKTKKMPEGFFVDAHMVEVLEPYDGRPKTETKPTKPAGRGCVRMPIYRYRR